jgi:hypothetical protein
LASDGRRSIAAAAAVPRRRQRPGRLGTLRAAAAGKLRPGVDFDPYGDRGVGPIAAAAGPARDQSSR